MSARPLPRRANGASPAGFHREIVASFSSYVEAERALDAVQRKRPHVGHVSIVAQGLRVVSDERPAARLWRAVEAGVAGGTVGALAALLAWLASVWPDPALPLAAGSFCGILGGLAADQVSLGRHGPGTELRLFADRYDVSADPRIAGEVAEAIDSEAWSL